MYGKQKGIESWTFGVVMYQVLESAIARTTFSGTSNFPTGSVNIFHFSTLENRVSSNL